MNGSHPKRNARAFTLIELLIVIGVIVILISMLIMGARYVLDNARKNGTRAALGTARAMFTEYESHTKLTRQPTLLYQGGGTVPCAATGLGGAADFWYFIEDAQGNNPNSAAPNKSIITPDWAQTKSTNVVQNTSVLMGLLLAEPANNKILSSLPANSKSNQIAANPLLLDNWGNPIIYVPAGGLTNVYINTGSATPIKGIVTTTGFHALTSPYTPNILDRPFFASAGPDGDISSGDDNIYSFESN